MSDATTNGRGPRSAPARKSKRDRSNGENGKKSGSASGNGGGARHVQAAPPGTSSSLARGLPRGDESLEKRDLLAALTALRKGDFSVRLPIHLDGLDGKIADTFNDVVDLEPEVCHGARAHQPRRRQGGQHPRARLDRRGARRLVRRGRVGQRRWSAISVQPTSEMARVIGAVAKGDLSQTMALEVGGRPLKGEFLRTAKTVNTMVEQLGSFASEVTRVAREVGTEGKLGGQADVRGVAGTWKDLTDSVNSMAGNLTAQVRNIAAVTTAVANGDLSKKITVDVKGEILELKNTINTMVDQLRSFASEVTRVAREVGTEGKLGGQADVKGVAGTWKDLTDSVNSMAGNLTAQVRNIAAVTTAVANGDLSKKITVDVKGEILELKNTINTMVDQLNSFASEVTRVAREVGTEGKLGGQADVQRRRRHVEGPDRLRQLDGRQPDGAGAQHRRRHHRRRHGRPVEEDHGRRQGRDPRAEEHHQHDGRSALVVRLRGDARRARGRHRGQARRPGRGATASPARGRTSPTTSTSWPSNLTVQVRDMSKVATAIANGDLSQKITVDVKGEILELKNTINTMVDQLSSFARR